MANERLDNDTLKSSRYLIERDIQKRIEPLEKDIQSLKKRYEKVLSDAQKAFEANERSYQTQLEKAKKEHIKAMRASRKETEAEIQKEQKHLESIKQKQTRELAELHNAHKKKINAIDEKIDSIEKERQKTLKSIEEKHKSTTQSYQDKIDLYKETLETNRERHAEKLDEALKTLENAQVREREKLATLKSSLDDSFADIETAIREKTDETRDDLKQEKNTIDYQINSKRKHLNELMKSVKTHLYDVGSTIKAPFEKSAALLQDLRKSLTENEKAFINRVDFDVRIEEHRLNALLEIDDNETVDKEIQTQVNEQLRLNTLRKKALKEHSDLKKTLINDTIEVFKTQLNALHTDFKRAFDMHESLLESQLNRLKKKLDILQKNGDINQRDLSALHEAMHSETFLDPFKTLFNDIFHALHAFERKRIGMLKSTLETLKPHYEEIDDIRFFLDTKDAVKEIRINEQKIAIEQRDASLNLEMDLTKRSHDKEILEIEQRHTINEKKANHAIEEAKQTQTVNDLFARKTAQTERHEHNFERMKADLQMDLREAHSNTDRDQVESRQSIDEAILERNREISELESLRHKRLKLEELNASKSTEHERLRLKVNQDTQTLKRLEETIRQREDRLEKRFERKKESAHEEFLENKAALEQELEDAKTRHEEKLDFIEKAYERETKRARRNIDAIEHMKSIRTTPIQERHLSHKKVLLDSLTALEDSELNDCIRMVHPSFKQNVIEHVHQTIKTLEETCDHLENHDKEKVRKDTDKERRQTLRLTKIEERYDEQRETIETLEEEIIESLEEAFAYPLEALRKKQRVSLREFRNLVEAALNDVKQTLETLYEKATRFISEGFNPMEETDRALLDKAEDSYKHALEEEKSRHEKALKPIKIRLDAIEDTYQDNLATIEEELEAQKQSLIGETYQEEQTIRAQLESQQEKLENLDATLGERKQAIEDRHKDDLEAIRERHEEKLRALRERYERQYAKIEERLKDTKAIYQQATINVEHALESIEATLKDTRDSNQEHFDYVKRKQERLVDHSKKERDEASKRAHEALDAKLEDFEEQILASKARLEEKIENVGRDIAEELREKDRRKTELEKSVSDAEYNLYSSFEAAYNALHEDIQNAFDALEFETTKGEAHIDAFIKGQKDTVDKFIAESVNAIKTD